MKPLVSIIITLFNYEEYVAECITSCIEQTYENIEIIVIDDCSTDRSYEVAEKFKNHIRLFQTDENRGYSHAKNVGIREAEGEYICFIDADDLLVPESLEVRMREFKENPSLGFVHGVALRWYGGDDLRGYNKKTYCHAQGRLYRRDLHKRFGLYYEKLRSMADKEWVYRIGVHPDSPMERVVNEKRIKRVVAWYHKHELAMHKTRRADPERNAKIKKIFKKRIKQLKKEGITKKNTEFL